jgi:hypothetical protein
MSIFTFSSFGVKAGRANSTGYTQPMAPMAKRNPTCIEPVAGVYLFGSLLRAARTEGRSNHLIEAHDMENDDARTLSPVKNSAWWLDDLSVAPSL